MNRSFSKRKNKAMKPYFLCSIFLLILSSAKANDIKYSVSEIPPTMLKDANVVKRVEEVEFEVVSMKETRLHYRYAITILNEAGEKYAYFSEYYDKLRHVSDIEGVLYDALGRVVKKIKPKDLQDVSVTDDNSLMDDNRMKVYGFYYRNYPYTVEFEATIRYDHTFYMPPWTPQEYPNLSVQKSTFTVITPGDYALRYKNFNYPSDPVVTTDKNKKVYTWKVENLPALKREYAAPKWHEITTTVSIAPTEFQLGDYKGSMSSWKEFGKFIYELKKDRDELTDDVKARVTQLTATATTDVEKIQVLYNYLQQNTRYISIQLGIGGWQPFDASYVCKKGYGDCKALANYMYSLLKAANIRSYYTLVKSGDYEHYLMDDFPSNQFDHVILCVPLQKDTMWLECTSQTEAPGYMGEFTGNRKALLISEDGGVLVSTPRYTKKENLLVRKINASLDAEGNMEMKVDTRYGGTQQDDLSMMINALSKDKVQKLLQQELELSTYNVNDFSYQETKAILPELDEHLSITVNNYATVTGKRLFITPNILNRNGSKLDEEENRSVDFVFYSEYRDEDDYDIEIPDGYVQEDLPQDVNINSKFGSYQCSSTIIGNKIHYHRVMEKYSGRFPAKDQSELSGFLLAVYKADRSRIVLVKK
jgi:transglutaminase-like putative cysteine protease